MKKKDESDLRCQSELLSQIFTFNISNISKQVSHKTFSFSRLKRKKLLKIVATSIF